jgi:hypothetical protein
VVNAAWGFNNDRSHVAETSIGNQPNVDQTALKQPQPI